MMRKRDVIKKAFVTFESFNGNKTSFEFQEIEMNSIQPKLSEGWMNKKEDYAKFDVSFSGYLRESKFNEPLLKRILRRML